MISCIKSNKHNNSSNNIDNDNTNDNRYNNIQLLWHDPKNID